MASINLLPTDVVRGHEAARATKALKTLSTVLGVVTLGIGFALGAYFFYQEKGITTLEDQYSTYKAQVLALESTENSLILVRDRLSKISELKTKYPYNNSLSLTNEILEQLPEGISIKQITGSSEDQTFTFGVPDSSAIQVLLDLFKNNQVLKQVVLKNTLYSPESGYQVVINVSNI